METTTSLETVLGFLGNQALPVSLMVIAVYVMWHAYQRSVTEHISDLRHTVEEQQEQLRLFSSGGGFEVSGLPSPLPQPLHASANGKAASIWASDPLTEPTDDKG